MSQPFILRAGAVLETPYSPLNFAEAANAIRAEKIVRAIYEIAERDTQNAVRQALGIPPGSWG